jgi:penicillin amidase
MQTTLLALALLLAVVVAAVALAYHVIFRRPLPRLSGLITVEGLDGVVEIRRDARGIPSVRATTRRDAWLAVGLLHGQDRLWQMEVQRRLAAGRLSEVVGPRAVSVDRLMRRLGLRRVSEAEWHVTHASGAVREELLAYTAGVNAAIADRPLAAEFRMLRHKPEPWQPEDTLAVGRLLSFSQSGNWEAQLLRMRMLKELGPELTMTLDPVLDGDRAMPLEGLESGAGTATSAWLAELAAAEDLLSLSAWAPASNSWVLHGSRTSTGLPLLANDPHAPIGIPSPWYRVHLETGTEELAGMTFCGAPYLVFGRNQHLAWGLVNSNVSAQDLYVERFNPNNPLQFEDRGEWQDAVRFREVIRVRGGRAEVEDVLVTRRGPIVSPAVGGTQPPMSLRWVGFDSEVDSISWTRRLNLATDWKGFRAAVSSCAAPALGVTYADREGNIGYRLSGFIPRRRPGQGRIPSRGWAAEDEWSGFIPLEEMPEVFNPETGVVIAANQPVALDSCPQSLVAEEAGTYRVLRLAQVLEGVEGISPGACAELQGDVRSAAAAAFRDLAVDAGRRFPAGRPEAALALLSGWDGEITLDAPAAALYERACVELFERAAGLRMSDGLRRHVLGRGATPLFPDGPFAGRLAAGAVRLGFASVAAAGAPGHGGGPVALWAGLAAAWDALEREQGPDAGRWRLGRARAFHLTHALAEAVPALGPVLNRGPFRTPGDADTVRVGVVSPGALGRGRVSAAFYRAVYDLSDAGGSAWSHVPGQSGHPASPNYADSLGSWLAAELEPMPWGRAAPGGRLLVLRPPG